MGLIKMTYDEMWRVTGNASALAIFYTLLGVFVSFVLYYVFDEYNSDWEKRSIVFQVADVSVEVALLAIISLWSGIIIEISPPLFYVRKSLDLLVDGYISGIFYIFAIFIFMDDLTHKLKFLFDKTLGVHFTNIFPQYGSILDLSLSYSPPRKTNEDKGVA
jgi:hypothetical protein